MDLHEMKGGQNHIVKTQLDAYKKLGTAEKT
jgi:hypothetical protein